MYAKPLIDYDNHNIAVLGTGALARQISIQAALRGHDVILFDENRKALDACYTDIRKEVRQRVEAGDISDAQAVLNNIFPTTDAKMAARNAALVLEALSKHPEDEADILAEFDALCLDETIFLTTTRTPFPLELADRAGRTGRLLSVRFHLPIWNNNVMDLVPHVETSDRTIRAAMGFARSIGLTPQLRLRAGWRKSGHALSMVPHPA